MQNHQCSLLLGVLSVPSASQSTPPRSGTTAVERVELCSVLLMVLDTTTKSQAWEAVWVRVLGFGAVRYDVTRRRLNEQAAQNHAQCERSGQ